MRELITIALLTLLLIACIGSLLILMRRRRIAQDMLRGHSDYSKIRRRSGLLG